MEGAGQRAKNYDRRNFGESDSQELECSRNGGE